MQLDRLTIQLRPRTHAQALDLGFALLHEQAGVAYRVWLTLWLPLVILAMLLAHFLPDYYLLWAIVPWWFRPLLERAPLYVMSRQVFGERIGWRAALRAWPGQWRGGSLRLLTWGRPLATARGLYQAISMLEGARGSTAAMRRRVIGRNGNGRAAWLFGLACFNFEAVALLGLLGGLSLFFGPGGSANPLYLLTLAHRNADSAFLVGMLCYGIGVGIIGPVYTAGCFTLYLNRRATLEAWDLEMVLRHIEPPAGKRGAARSSWPLAAPMVLAAVLASLLLPPTAARAAGVAAPALPCQPPEFLIAMPRQADHDAAQAGVRREVAQLYDTDTLRGYVCREHWHFKDQGAQHPAPASPRYDLSAWAQAVKATLIATAVVALAWLLYRYRGMLPMLRGQGTPRDPAAASEIGGLDIRPETLPADVAGTTLQLWDAGEARAALALLYRATLSRLVEHDGLQLYRGATEGDCLRLVDVAARAARLAVHKAELTASVTQIWLDGAYGGHWPQRAALAALCANWRTEFHARRVRGGPRLPAIGAAERPS